MFLRFIGKGENYGGNFNILCVIINLKCVFICFINSYMCLYYLWRIFEWIYIKDFKCKNMLRVKEVWLLVNYLV